MVTQHDPAEGVSAADASRRRQLGAVGDPNSRVERTCTPLQTNGPAGDTTEPRSLSDFRDVAALVLLGGPGAGKTNEFEAESEALGDVAMPVSARSFVTFEPPCPEWWNKTLFIDGLDEMRAGSADARPKLDQVRNRLHQLGRPPFRLSCREADWLGNNDLQALAEVSSDSQITVLRLDPLAPSAARELLNLRHPTVDAQKFMVEASRQGIHSMLTNPLTLTLLADAVAPSGAWPDNRRDIFQAACLQMARDLNGTRTVAAVSGSPMRLSWKQRGSCARCCCSLTWRRGHTVPEVTRACACLWMIWVVSPAIRPGRRCAPLWEPNCSRARTGRDLSRFTVRSPNSSLGAISPSVSTRVSPRAVSWRSRPVPATAGW